jgi:hypothetical protein
MNKARLEWVISGLNQMVRRLFYTPFLKKEWGFCLVCYVGRKNEKCINC